jgi:crossover junction endodeoxyribonuclease RuvC
LSDCCFIGVDPGSRKLGYACLKKSSNEKLIIIKSGEISFVSGEALESKLSFVYDFFEGLLINLNKNNIDLDNIRLIIEEQFVDKDVRSSFVLVSIRAVLMMLAYKNSIPVKCIFPSQVKKTITGNGLASKSTVILAITRLFEGYIPTSHDEADAIAIALAAALSGF